MAKWKACHAHTHTHISARTHAHTHTHTHTHKRTHARTHRKKFSACSTNSINLEPVRKPCVNGRKQTPRSRVWVGVCVCACVVCVWSEGRVSTQSSVQNSLSPVPNLDQPAARRGSGGGAGGGVGSDGAFLKANAQGQPKLRPSRIPQSKNRRTRALSERSRAGGSAPAAGAGFSLNNKVGSP